MITFNAKWNRAGTIKLERRRCNGCRKRKLCLCIDSSEGEYGPGCICQDCVNELFAKNKTQEDQNEKGSGE